jgi:decaprenyl-phosphate phosphoribosyltransferase
MLNYLILARLNQWHKNFIVLIPLFFSGQIQFQNIFNSLIGFFIFCFLSSIIYIINDLIDKESYKKKI